MMASRCAPISDSPRGKELVGFLKGIQKPWKDHQINAMRRARGYCEYCGTDVVASVEAFSDSEWDHVIPKKHGGEHEKNGVPIDVVFEENIALACYKCNELKGEEVPHGVAVEDLKELPREERIAAFQSMMLERRRQYRVVEVFAAFRELVEIERCARHGV